MMNKKRSSKKLRYKYILFLPCILILFALINMQCQDTKKRNEQYPDHTHNSLSSGEVQSEESLQPTDEEITTSVPGIKSEPLDHVEEMPEFPGGVKELMKYLSSTINYPAEAVEKGIQGTVVCKFIVDDEGKVDDVKVIRGLDEQLDAEAIRVIKAMPKWIPGKNNGEAVSVYYTLPIRYRLQ